MPAQRIPGGHLVLFGLSIACSLGSLAALLTHPVRTGSLRTALNGAALVLFMLAVVVVARGTAVRRAKRRGAGGRGI